MFKNLLEIGSHEMKGLLKSRRLVGIAIIYLGAATLGSVVFVGTATHVPTEQSSYQGLIALFTGVPPSEIAPSLIQSLVLPAFLWGSLGFLPVAILLTSFDQLAADVQSKALRMTVLRVPRWLVVMGKAGCHTAIFAVLMVLASCLMVGIASAFRPEYSLGQSIQGLMRVWLTLIPVGASYVGLSALASSLAKQPFGALMQGISLLMLLQILDWLRWVPENHTWSWLRHLRWLCPAPYEAGLWTSGWLMPLASCTVYCIFAALFLGLAVQRMEHRDL